MVKKAILLTEYTEYLLGSTTMPKTCVHYLIFLFVPALFSIVLSKSQHHMLVVKMAPVVNLGSAISVLEFWLSQEFRRETQIIRKVYLESHKGRRKK